MKLELICQIEDAFPVDPVLEKNQIVQTTSSADLESVEIANFFHHRKWADLVLTDLRRESSALFFLSRSGFVYFLPAFLRAVVVDPVDADLIPSAIVLSLTPQKRTITHPLPVNRVLWLNLQQCKIVLKVLELLAVELPYDKSLCEVDIIIHAVRTQLLRLEKKNKGHSSENGTE